MLDNLMMAFGVENALCLLNLRLNQPCKTGKCPISIEDTGLDVGGASFSRVDGLGKNYLIGGNGGIDAQKTAEGRVEVYHSQEFDKPNNAKAKFLENCCRVDSFPHHHPFFSVYPSQESFLNYLEGIKILPSILSALLLSMISKFSVLQPKSGCQIFLALLVD